jgi:hypothetical protein
MARTARMHEQAGVRQARHQLAGATGMIEMHVGENQPIDIGWRQSCILQCIEHARHAEVGAAVDKGAATMLNHEIRRIELWPYKAGIDGVNAVAHG